MLQAYHVYQRFRFSSSLQHTTNGKNPRALSQEDEDLEEGLLASNERLISY